MTWRTEQGQSSTDQQIVAYGKSFSRLHNHKLDNSPTSAHIRSVKNMCTAILLSGAALYASLVDQAR